MIPFTRTLDWLVLNSLASAFNAKLKDFTFYTSLPSLPKHEATLAKFLDQVPTGLEFFYEHDDSIAFFSHVYGQILQAQINEPLAIKIGRDNYNNTDYWIEPYDIPTYSPIISSVIDKLEMSNGTKVTTSSSTQKVRVPAYPQFPILETSGPLMAFYQQVANSEVTVSTTFSESTSLPITFGHWYYAGAFLYAYQTPDNWDNTIISWDDVFGKDGILQYINYSIAVVSDMTMKIEVQGDFDQDIIALLESIPQPVVFPFYHQINSSNLTYTIDEGKLIITLQVPQSQSNNYIFGMQYRSVKYLLGA